VSVDDYQYRANVCQFGVTLTVGLGADRSQNGEGSAELHDDWLDRCASHGQEAAQQESIEGASRSGLYTTLLTTKTTTGVVHAAATVALIVIP